MQETLNDIKLSKKQSIEWHYLEDKTTTEIFYGGAAGGGKSFFGCLWHIIRRVTYPETRGLIGRSKLSNLKESTLITFFKVCGMLGYISGVDYKYNAQDHVINWSNGSKTILKDLFLYPSDPDFNSLGSTEYTDVFIDEAPEITLKAFEILNSRIRWMLPDYNLIPKILVTGNPSPGWVKERFVKSVTGVPVELKPYQKIVQALVTDNPDLDFVELYKVQLGKLTNDYDRQRLLHGDWDVEQSVLNPFAYQYDRFLHESESAIFRPDKQLLINIDFNLNPFAVNFSHMWRDEQGEHFHTFDEQAIEKGSIPKMIEFIKTKYYNQLPFCLLTGDAMGHKGDLSQRDNASYYVQLQRGLRIKDSQIRTPRGNPTHDNSRTDMNYVLANFQDYKINPVTCPQTCYDMRTVQCDAFGSIIKRNRNDLSQRADFIDCQRYSIDTHLRKWIDTHMKIRK
jgi:hypothetical protein